MPTLSPWLIIGFALAGLAGVWTIELLTLLKRKRERGAAGERTSEPPAHDHRNDASRDTGPPLIAIGPASVQMLEGFRFRQALVTHSWVWLVDTVHHVRMLVCDDPAVEESRAIARRIMAEGQGNRPEPWPAGEADVKQISEAVMRWAVEELERAGRLDVLVAGRRADGSE
jgi:hypothetical protein